jgi:hypothetical protein
MYNFISYLRRNIMIGRTIEARQPKNNGRKTYFYIRKIQTPF